jgi:arsenate reductase
MGGSVSPDADRLVLLHNPRCSKSRAAKALLEQRKVEFDERRYLEEPLSRAELADLAARLGHSPHSWVRTGEDAYREAGLDASAADERVLDAMAAHPILIERPIAIRGARAVVGRPPEDVLSLV